LSHAAAREAVGGFPEVRQPDVAVRAEVYRRCRDGSTHGLGCIKGRCRL